MSAPKSTAVVMPTEGGAPVPGDAAAVTKMAGGGLVLSPLPLSGGRKGKGRKTKRLSKKVLKMFKKGSAKKLAKLMKGGDDGEAVVTGETATTEGARRKRKGGKTARKSRHSFLY